MSDEKCKKCAEKAEAWDTLFEVKRMVESIDYMIYQATEAGFDKGRLYGLLEAAGALEKSGYPELGAVVRKIAGEELVIWGKSAGDA